jgi:hypothetical protein
VEGEAASVIESLISITQRVIGESAIEDFQPTLINFDTRTVSVLDGVPADVDARSAIREWLAGKDLETYGVAFRAGEAIHLAAYAKARNAFAAMYRTEDGWRVTSLGDDPL